MDTELEYIYSMPKIELHAHLNGSISEQTLANLIKNKPEEARTKFEEFQTSIADGHNRTLKECFDMFKLVHSIVNDCDALYQATCDVIDEFASDGVVYLELRSTPRVIPESDITQTVYMETILNAIHDKTVKFEELNSYDVNKRPIVVRYLASIDRRNTIEYAMETVNVAIELKEKTGLIVGIDLSGDESINDARNFFPVLEKARSNGLKLSLHLAEVPGLEEQTNSVLDFLPDRIGHGLFIHPEFGGSENLLKKMRKLKVPLELCLTSNVKGQLTPSFDAHHFRAWYELEHPIIICTDDKGVFATTLTKEYKYLHDMFNLSDESVGNLVFESINYIFETEEAKEAVRKYFTQWRNQY